MKSIDEYKITKEGSVYYNSKLCSVACSLGYLNQFSPLDNRINELVQSFFIQWQFIISTYDKLYKLFATLNERSDHHDSENIVSPYDIKSAESEVDFKNYSYLLIVSMKTFLDLFSCLVDITQNQVIREEHKLPDLFNFAKTKNDNSIPEIMNTFKNLKDKNKYPWIALLKNVRDRIIHRGYNLKPIFAFTKSDVLNIQMYKGIDFYTDVVNIEIGKLFDNFMVDMPLIEDKISNILIDKIESLNKKLLLNVAVKYEGLMTEFSYKEIEPIQ